MSINAHLAIALGAIVGAMGRFWLQQLSTNLLGLGQLGTFLSNLAGCFLIGLSYPLLRDGSELLRLAILTGALGSLTTLSSLHFETFQLLQAQKHLLAAAHWLGGSCVCLGATYLGYLASRVF